MAYRTKEQIKAYAKKWGQKNKQRKKQSLNKWRKNNPDMTKNWLLKHKFGISLEQYKEMLRRQNFVCKLCFKDETSVHHKSKKVKQLAVDHCHKTGKVRGLLCTACNTALGKARDRLGWLDRAKLYLKGEI